MRPRSGTDRRRIMIASAVVVVVTLVALVSLAPSLYDVEDKGKGPPIVPYEGTGVVYKVKVLGTFTVYADEESQPNLDTLSSIGLIAATTMCLMTLLLLTAAQAAPRVRRFFAFATAGLAFLAFDELFAFHETLGHNLQFLADLPGIDRPDDVVFFSYAIPLAIFAWAFRDILLAERRAVQLFAVGTVLYGIAVMGDIVGVKIDEPAEVLATVCLVGGLVIITAVTLRRGLDLEGVSGSRFAETAKQAERPPVLVR
jgi:hypothetical protein